jgi:hypothetical protein
MMMLIGKLKRLKEMPTKWTKNKIDSNQAGIVKDLLTIPGVSVAQNHDDVLIGFRGRTFWIEIKNPDEAVMKRTGEFNPRCLQPAQKELIDNWKGHYRVCWTLDQILAEIGI